MSCLGRVTPYNERLLNIHAVSWPLLAIIVPLDSRASGPCNGRRMIMIMVGGKSHALSLSLCHCMLMYAYLPMYHPKWFAAGFSMPEAFRNSQRWLSKGILLVQEGRFPPETREYMSCISEGPKPKVL